MNIKDWNNMSDEDKEDLNKTNPTLVLLFLDSVSSIPLSFTTADQQLLHSYGIIA